MSTEKRGSAEELSRLQRELDAADRVYNDALTRLDAAIQKPRDLPHPPPAYDEFQVTPLNQRWELLSLKPEEGRGWLRRVRAHAWSMVAPLFERQQAFNSALVDHVNRNIALHREVTKAFETTLAMLAEDQRRFIEYQTLLVLYLQQITPYVDTKDRHVAGLMHGLAAGLSALSDDLQKHRESMSAARERRFENQVNDLRTPLSVMQHAIQTLKREVERATGAAGATGCDGAQAPPKREARRRMRPTPTSMSRSKTSSAAHNTTFASASKPTCPCSKAPAMCSTWDAAGVNFSISSARMA